MVFAGQSKACTRTSSTTTRIKRQRLAKDSLQNAQVLEHLPPQQGLRAFLMNLLLVKVVVLEHLPPQQGLRAPYNGVRRAKQRY